MKKPKRSKKATKSPKRTEVAVKPVFGGASEAVKALHHNRIKLPLAGIVHQFIKLGARVFSARLAYVNVFADEVESSRRAVSPQIAYLQLTALVLGAHTCVDSYSHDFVLLRAERKRLVFAHRAFLIAEYDDEHPHLAPPPIPPVEQGGGEFVLNLLCDVFRRSQHVTGEQFISKLERSGIEYNVRRVDTETYIGVGRFCYRLNEQGQSRGGWIRNCAEDRKSE